MDNPIASTEIEAVIHNLPKDKSEGPYSFKGQIYQTFKKLMLCLLKLFQKISEEGRVPNSFHEVTITLIPKPVTDNTQKEN